MEEHRIRRQIDNVNKALKKIEMEQSLLARIRRSISASGKIEACQDKPKPYLIR